MSWILADPILVQLGLVPLKAYRSLELSYGFQRLKLFVI